MLSSVACERGTGEREHGGKALADFSAGCGDAAESSEVAEVATAAVHSMYRPEVTVIENDHNWIIDYAFGPKGPTGPKFQLSERDRCTLKQASRDADGANIGEVLFGPGQGRAGSYKHSMRGGKDLSGKEQSVEEATALRDQWIGECLRFAGALERTGNNHNNALYRLGLGMHTIADSFSPDHEGLQPWCGTDLHCWPSDVRHRIDEGSRSNPYEGINRFRAMQEKKADAAMALRRYYRAFAQGTADVPKGAFCLDSQIR